MAVTTNTATRFFSEKLTIKSNMSVGQFDLIEEQQRPARHVPRARLEASANLDLSVAAATRHDLYRLEPARGLRHEHERAVAVGDDRGVGHLEALRSGNGER